MSNHPNQRARQLCVYAGMLLGIPAALGQSYLIQTVAGTTRLKNGAPALSTPLRRPFGAVQDSNGNVYIADDLDSRILMVGTDGNIHVIAGTGVPGFSGDNGPALNATFDEPRNPYLDGKGGLYVVDYYNARVRLINLATKIVTTVAGNGKYPFSGDGGPAVSAGMDPSSVATDAAGNLYIADYSNNRIRKVSALNQTISTIAGQSISGDAGDGGPASASVLNGPLGLSIDSQGMIYFADYWNNYVRVINPQTGMINAFAGNGNFGLPVDNAPASTAPLLVPIATAAEPDGSIVILEFNYIQRVANGIIHTIAGTGAYGYSGDGGAAISAEFALPAAISAAPNGDIIVSDTGNFRVRRIHGIQINAVAGTGITENIPATTAFLNGPEDVAAGAGGGFVFPDTNNSVVRQVSGGTISGLAGTGVAGSGMGELYFPQGVAVDPQGNVYVADTDNNRILRLALNGAFTVVAGSGNYGDQGDGGSALVAALAGPTAVAVDAAGNLYIADYGNCAIRMVDTSQKISTLAGTGLCASTGNNGQANLASVDAVALALDGKGNLYLAEPDTDRVRKIDLNSKIITPVAGAGSPGYSGDGSAATVAQLAQPTGVTVDAQGDVFIADFGNSVVRMIKGAAIYTVAGTGPGNFTFDFESGPALGVSIDPIAVSAAPDGSIYIADAFNDRIRQLTPVIPAKATVSSGNVQTGVPGSQVAVSVTVTDGSGNPVSGATVTFTVASGSATLSASTVQTNASGVATVLVTLGSAGPVQIQAVAQGLSPVMISLTSAGPQINSGGVEGAGLSVPPVTTLSVGGIASVFGAGFGGPATFASIGQGDLVNGALPAQFMGVCVKVSGVKSPIFGVSDTQVNFQVPAVSGNSASVEVAANCGTSHELASTGLSAQIAAAAPEFFYFQTNQDGHNPVAAVDSLNNAYTGAANLFPGGGTQPAQPGEYITVYATGFGATNPSVAPGVLAPGLARVSAPFTVFLNGQPLASANILYAGTTPSSAGLYQLDFQVPANAPNGDLSLAIKIGGIASPAGAYITVQAPGQ